MDIFEKLLKNRFDMTKCQSGFIDNCSDMEICANDTQLGLTNLNSRGLDSCRTSVSGNLLTPILNIGGKNLPINLTETITYPWILNQNGCVTAEGAVIGFEATLASPKKNTALWFFKITADNAVKASVSFKGSINHSGNENMIHCYNNSVTCIYNQNPATDPYPTWNISSEIFNNTVKLEGYEYVLSTNEFEISPDEPIEFAVRIEYFYSRDLNDKKIPQFESVNTDKIALIEERKNYWETTLAPILEQGGDLVKRIGCAAGLIRCGCEVDTDDNKKIKAAFCSVSNWSSLVCFWDTLIAAVGYSHFSPDLAIDAVRGAFLRQRENGFLSSTMYIFKPHDEIYPQPPIAAWALTRILENSNNDERVISFLDEILPKVEKLHHWYLDTQDHDGDGMPEWRFTGSIADNSPLYDYYARPISKDLNGLWNIYLPPIASVSLAAFLIKEEKCLAQLYKLKGNEEKVEYYLEKAEYLEQKLIDTCFDGELFHDHDIILGKFNKVLTLYSFLPLWAGIDIPDDIKKNMIENYLLNPEHFFGEYPMPYVAYSEETYRPNGYWRGRIWPHTTIWMTELLIENGYKEAGTEVLRRLIKMMNQRPAVLENYNSSPAMGGGGEPEFLWSYATYLQLSKRLSELEN